MEKLFNELRNLVLDNDTPFYSSIQTGDDGATYEIFSYHFTDKESWLLPSALESRGIMFEVTEDGEFIRIASRTMQKFFNHNSRTKEGEVDFIDYGDPCHVMNKADGSLISSYLDSENCIMLKSKVRLSSDYANLAMDLMGDNIALFDFIKWCERDGYTVNMELVSPDPKFRIVLHYAEPQLIVLNARQRETGEYLDFRSIPPELFAGTVDCDVLQHLDTVKGIEGYVCIDPDNNWFKCKTKWYLERHRAKDFINNTTAFTLLVLKDEADDVFSLMEDQPEVLAEMRALQHTIISKANTITNKVTNYFNNNSKLSRRDYAIKGKSELNWIEFPLAMQYYTKGEPNWGEFLAKQVKKINWED